MAKLDAFFKLMVDQGASDLHLVSGSQPILRVSGELQRVRYHVLENDDLKKMLYEVAPEQKIKQFEELGDVDFAYEIPGLARYRANYFVQKYGVAAVFRQIPDTILTVEQLGLPAVLNKLPMYPKGLVLVTGPTGSGKSTTLAAVVDYANTHRKDHILTIEDPVEFVHKSKNCVVNHREVGIHTRSFATALRAALREDPDVIMVGEMRDLETISLAITAAETGHLVLGTLHTGNASRTLNRLLDVFPPDQQEQIRIMVSESLRGVISQHWIPRADGKGRVLALEILTNTPAVANVIREAKTFMLPGIIQTGKKQGMQLMDDALVDLASRGLVSAEEAYTRADQKDLVRQYVK